MSSHAAPPSAWTAETIPIARWGDLAPARPLAADDVAIDEGIWTISGAHHLAWRAWRARESVAPARATVALMHGYAEHSGRYDHVAAALVRAGYQVIAIDARGHGRSSGPRGHVQRYDEYLDDLAQLVRRGGERWPDAPLFVLGHSNGGLIALRYALRRPPHVAGFIVSSPLCKLALEVPVAKELMGRVASRLLPRLAIPAGLAPAYVSRLGEVVEAYRRDPLIFRTTTARWFVEARRAMADLAERAHTLDQAVLFLVAGADHIVDPQATERVARAAVSPEVELEVYESLYHEILNESSWREVLRRAVLWMEQRRAKVSAAP